MPDWICGYCKHFRWTPPLSLENFEPDDELDGKCVGLVNIPVMWADRGCADWVEHPNPEVKDDNYYIENKLCPKRIQFGLYLYHGYEIKLLGYDKQLKIFVWEARNIKTGEIYYQDRTLKDVVSYIDYKEYHP